MDDMNEGGADDQGTENIVDELDAIPDATVHQKSRFSSLIMKGKVKTSLIMKGKVKTRGRPIRKTKQLTFNKTAVDKNT